jgi:hypothetical protein
MTVPLSAVAVDLDETSSVVGLATGSTRGANVSRQLHERALTTYMRDRAPHAA